jgi:hypothetical protein
MKKIITFGVPLLSLFLLSACGSDDADDDSVIEDSSSIAVDITKFSSSTVVEEVSCTLSNGESSTCYEITINGFPSDRDELGPFCPPSTSTEAADAGKWFDDGVLYDLTGEFITNLDTFYGDNFWELYDENGNVKITDTQESCEAAARPDVDEAYYNYCVECDISYYEEETGGGVSSIYTIPATPVARSNTSSVDGSVGIAFNGVTLDAAAPAADILRAYTIAAFDDCVGHVNPFAGYHYHGANHGEGTCPGVEYEEDGHAGAFGYALDGYAIYSMLDESGEEETDLDECRGHTDETRGYHYHSAGAGENMFIGCFAGETAE